MAHSQYMINLSLADPNRVSGHALMATAPSREYCARYGMFFPRGQQDDCHLDGRFDLPKPDLAKMLMLSRKLASLKSEELTPVMAWAKIMAHPRGAELDKEEINAIKEELRPKVACYG
jgi:hypothetical protein